MWETQKPLYAQLEACAQKNLVLAQLDEWNADARSGHPSTGLSLTSVAFIDGISSPGGSQEGIVRACLLSFERVEWKLALINCGCETCLRSRSICVRGIEAPKWALVFCSLWNARVKYPASPNLNTKWIFSVFSYFFLRKPYVELPLNAITDTSLVCFISNPRRS